VTNDDLLCVQFTDALPSMIWVVALAGAFYPIVFAVLVGIVALAHSIWFGTIDGDLFFWLSLAIGCTIGGFVGFFYALFVFVAVYWLVYWLVRSLQMRGSVVWLAAFSGGLTGFMAVLPIFLDRAVDPQLFHPSWGLVIIAVIGPGLTTVMGQIAGAWGGLNAGSYVTRAANAAPLNNKLPDDIVEGISTQGNEPLGTRRFQFRIWHLLVVSAWVSLLLTLIRLSGVDFTFALELLVAWTLYQAATLWLIVVVAGWYWQWKTRRKSCST
jgi:hypothetical protein